MLFHQPNLDALRTVDSLYVHRLRGARREERKYQCQHERKKSHNAAGDSLPVTASFLIK